MNFHLSDKRILSWNCFLFKPVQAGSSITVQGRAGCWQWNILPKTSPEFCSCFFFFPFVVSITTTFQLSEIRTITANSETNIIDLSSSRPRTALDLVLPFPNVGEYTSTERHTSTYLPNTMNIHHLLTFPSKTKGRNTPLNFRQLMVRQLFFFFV